MINIKLTNKVSPSVDNLFGTNQSNLNKSFRVNQLQQGVVKLWVPISLKEKGIAPIL